jgi:Zn-dependent M28 family amino/carboxypeptidase
MNLLGRTRDLAVVGYGQSDLEDRLAAALAAQGRRMVPDPEPEKGFFYRSDQLSFARKGVPSLYTDAGLDYVGRPEGWGRAQRDDYTTNRYHKPSDEFDSGWVYDGVVEDLEAYYAVAIGAASDPAMPRWKEKSEFRAIREQALRSSAAGAGGSR